jgi:hypothetical protein
MVSFRSCFSTISRISFHRMTGVFIFQITLRQAGLHGDSHTLTLKADDKIDVIKKIALEKFSLKNADGMTVVHNGVILSEHEVCLPLLFLWFFADGCFLFFWGAGDTHFRFFNMHTQTHTNTHTHRARTCHGTG